MSERQNNKNILILAGDGIGPEAMGEVKKIINWLNQNSNAQLSVTEDFVGGAAIDAYGTSLSDETLAKAREADIVLLGAVGGPKWADVDYDIRPEAGLLKLRKELGLFANLRPAIVFDALAEASSLKTDLVKGLDILIVRELTCGIYFGQPRGIEDLGGGERSAVDTQLYRTHEIKRIGCVAFELARKRSSRVCSVDKANVMASGKLWREDMTRMQLEAYSDIELSHMYVDNCAMQLVRNPKQFDVIVTDNLFGDILSDEAAMMTGSLGMLPSAALGDGGPGLYEPVHGSAPDIAGQNIANPLASILSLAMALRYSLDMDDQAAMIENAVQDVLAQGFRTADIAGEDNASITTSAMGEHLIESLNKLQAAEK